MTTKTASIVWVGTGIAAIVAFFLPFLDLGGPMAASGWDILVADLAPWTTRAALLALPIGGLCLCVAGATGHARARFAGFLFGAGVFGYLGYSMVRLFLATTGVGLWLTLAAALVALVSALAVKPRG